MSQSKKERTQKDIIDVAKGIIHDKGHDAITVRYLAELTGYSYTNLYYYYKNVNALLWTLRIDMIEDMITELTAVTYKNTDPIQEILDALFSYTDYFFKNPNVFRFFYFYTFVQPEGDDSYQQLEQRFSSMWQLSFSRLIYENIIPTEDLEVVAKTIIYSLQGMIMLSFSSNGATGGAYIKDELKNVVNHLLNSKNHKEKSNGK